MTEPGRNMPCWCGSGLKYKKCHLNRLEQAKENVWDVLAANRKAFNEKRCCARGGGLGECEGSIVRAHTVSRGPNLSKIAREGKVVTYKVDHSKTKNENTGLVASEIGIREASVFFGFCRKHDQDLFSCIENEAFVGTPKQCLSIAYRTLSRELYGKDAGGNLRETLRGADKGRSLPEQLNLQRMLKHMDEINVLSQQDLRRTYDKLTRAIAKDRYEVLSSLVIEFDRVLPFMFAGGWSALVDIFEVELQDANSEDILEQVFFSSFVANDRSFVCISWLKRDNAPGEVIAEQLRAISASGQAAACLFMVARHVENVFYSPAWFHALSKKQRDYIGMLALAGVDFDGSLETASLRLDLDFELPSAIGWSSV